MHHAQLNVELANAKSMATLTAPVKTGPWPSCGHSMPFIGKTPHQCRQNLVLKRLQGALLIPRHRARRQNLKRIKRQGFGPQLLGAMQGAVFNQINPSTTSKKSRPCKWHGICFVPFLVDWCLLLRTTASAFKKSRPACGALHVLAKRAQVRDRTRITCHICCNTVVIRSCFWSMKGFLKTLECILPFRNLC